MGWASGFSEKDQKIERDRAHSHTHTSWRHTRTNRNSPLQRSIHVLWFLPASLSVQSSFSRPLISAVPDLTFLAARLDEQQVLAGWPGVGSCDTPKFIHLIQNCESHARSALYGIYTNHIRIHTYNNISKTTNQPPYIYMQYHAIGRGSTCSVDLPSGML